MRHVAEPLHIEQLVSQAAVETLRVTVLPMASESGVHAANAAIATAHASFRLKSIHSHNADRVIAGRQQTTLPHNDK